MLYSGEIGRNLLDWVYIPGDHGDVMLTYIGEEIMLTATVRENTKLGLLLFKMRYAAKDLQRVVG